MNIRDGWPGDPDYVPEVWKDAERLSEKFRRLAELARMSRFDVMAEQYDAIADGIESNAVEHMLDSGLL